MKIVDKESIDTSVSLLGDVLIETFVKEINKPTPTWAEINADLEKGVALLRAKKENRRTQCTFLD